MTDKIKCNRWLLGTLVVAGVAFAASAALADESTSPIYPDARMESLQARLEATEKKLAELQTQETELDRQRARETRKLVREVLADAESRVTLCNTNSPVTVNVGGFGIVRWQYNNGGGNGRQSGFNLPYERLELSGKVYDWGYVLSGEFSDQNAGRFDLVDAYITGDVFDMDVKVGQFVTSFYKGYTDSPLDQMIGEYSVIATTFGQGRSQGIELSREFGDLRIAASYNDGFNSANGAGSLDNDWGLSVRADYEIGGGFAVGAAYAYQDGLLDYSTYTVDASYVNGNLNAGVSWVSSDANTGFGDNYGLVGTLGYQCTENLQGFVQYEYGKAGAGLSDLNMLTVGCNYDLAKGVRWTNSFGWAFDALEGWNTYRSGWNDSIRGGEFLVTSQLSLIF